MLIIIWLLIMVEDNINSIRDIMSYDPSTNKVTIKNDNLKQTFIGTVSSDSYYDGKLILDDNNNYIMDIMLFHAIFKQYMFKFKDIKKTKMQEVESQFSIIRNKHYNNKIII